MRLPCGDVNVNQPAYVPNAGRRIERGQEKPRESNKITMTQVRLRAVTQFGGCQSGRTLPLKIARLAGETIRLNGFDGKTQVGSPRRAAPPRESYKVTQSSTGPVSSECDSSTPIASS